MALGAKDIQVVFDVFWSRIERDTKAKSKRRLLSRHDSYEAIPYHFHDGLRKAIGEHPEYRQRLAPWLERLTQKWSILNLNIGHFLERVAISSIDVIRSIIQRGDDASIKKAITMLNPIEPVDVEICFEIVRRTDNADILNDVDRLMHATGLVSGEDGLARAHENRAAAIAVYLRDDDIRVSRYAARVIEILKNSAARERQRSAEDRQVRKTDFE